MKTKAPRRRQHGINRALRATDQDLENLWDEIAAAAGREAEGSDVNLNPELPTSLSRHARRMLTARDKQRR